MATLLAGITLAQVGTVLTLGATAIGAMASIQAGNAAKAAGARAQQGAEIEAKQLERMAGQERSAGQRRASEERRRLRFAQSRLQAVAAASGGGAITPTTETLMGALESEGAYRSLFALYEGEEVAAGRQVQASAARYGGASEAMAGRIRQRTSRWQAASQLSSGFGGTLLERYG